MVSNPPVETFSEPDLAYLRRVGQSGLWVGPLLFFLCILPPRDLSSAGGCLVGLQMFVDGHNLKTHPTRIVVQRFLVVGLLLWIGWLATWAWKGITLAEWGWSTPLFFLVGLPSELRLFRILRSPHPSPMDQP
jgi:hypothetical protein